MATEGPKHQRSEKQQKKATSKRSSDEGRTYDVTCRCRGCRKTMCQYCKKSPKKLKLLKGKTADNLTDEPEVVIVPRVVTEELGSRFASRYWDVNFSEYFSKSFKKVLEIKPRGQCFTIRLFNKKIWAPIINKNVVKVYNEIGIVHKTINIKCPSSVEQVDNGNIFIACHSNSGLYVMDDNQAPQKICDGSFADVCAYRDKVCALEYEKKLIMEFCYKLDPVEEGKRWRSVKEWRIDEASVYNTLIVIGDEVYMSHYNGDKVSQYNTQGHCIKQIDSGHLISGNLHHARLCGIDRQSHLLVADWFCNVYKILDPNKEQWRSTGVKGERYVYDVILDDEGNMWLSQSNGSDHIITKHEPQ